MPSSIDLASGLVIACWLIFAGVWWAAAPFARSNKRRQTARSRLLQTAMYVGGWLLLVAPPWLPLGPLRQKCYPISSVSDVVAVALTIAGIGFAVWARAALGKNWSGTVTLKEGHELIEVGPYAIVRHPIYTGLLTAMLGTAVLRGRVAGFLGVGIYAAAFAAKIAIEERFLVSEFGPAFESYRRRVKALIPFVL